MEKKELLKELLAQGITDKKILAEKMGYVGRSAVSSLNRFAKSQGISLEEPGIVEARPVQTPATMDIERVIADRVDQILLSRIDFIADAVKERMKSEDHSSEAVELFHIPDGVLSGKTSQRTIRIDDKTWEELNRFSREHPSISKTDILSFLLLEGIKKYNG